MMLTPDQITKCVAYSASLPAYRQRELIQRAHEFASRQPELCSVEKLREVLCEAIMDGARKP